MPSYDLYRKMYTEYTRSAGDARRLESDEIMNATWWEDINSQKVYLYDMYHDEERTKLHDLKPWNDALKTEIDAKVVSHTTQTYDKDTITHHLQLRPKQQCNVGYFKEYFIDRYDGTFPIGLYVDIKDTDGKYARWLIVDKADYHNAQFPTFEILPCNFVLRYVMNGKKWEIPAVLRSQNSYNSGIWRDCFSLL